MRSRTSFFNKQLYRKNLTRFAPVFLLYILSLFMGLLLMYQDDREMARSFWFASRLADSIQAMALVNLFFGAVMAMLLFGDLFNSRLCMGLHAMPLRRETIFVTNVLSGMTFSLVPTALMTLACIPLLNATCVQNAWTIALWWYLAVNLQFLAFFGIAVFCVFLTGNRVAMLAVYAALNCGAYLVYFALYTLYVPLLYGVVLTDAVPSLLTPGSMIGRSIVELDNYLEVFRPQFLATGAYAGFEIQRNNLTILFLWTAVGIALLGVSLLLYRRRNLECAGDAVAVRFLRPVFQVAAAVAVGVAAVAAMEVFLSYRIYSQEKLRYMFLAFGLVLGWFGSGMFLERSTRVFRRKDFLQLGILGAAIALSITATKLDILGIEDWKPAPEQVRSITITASSTAEFTDEADIRLLLELQEMALEDRVQDTGYYPLRYIQSVGKANVKMPEEGFRYEEDYSPDEAHVLAGEVTLRFQLTSGRTVIRRYPVWYSFEEGEIIREFMSRWEVIRDHAWWSGRPLDLSRVNRLYIDHKDGEQALTQEDCASLLEAIRLDCEERTMAQSSSLHKGYFAFGDNENEYRPNYFYFSIIDSDDNGAQFMIYPDSAHTLEWFISRGYLNVAAIDTSYTGLH